MKNLVIFLILLFAYSNTKAQVKAETKMYRIQDTIHSESGWYFGKSTDGNFSIELPVPFNDFTIIVDGFYTYVVGSKSQEGIKFSASEMKNTKKHRKVDLDAIVEGSAESNYTISNVTKTRDKNSKSISWENNNDENGGMLKCIYSKKTMYLLIIDYPISQKALAKELTERYFESFKILGD